jgi:hypothetical protein
MPLNELETALRADRDERYVAVAITRSEVAETPKRSPEE